VKSLVIGASAGLGRAIADTLAAAGHELFIVASSADDLASVASDLSLRHRVKVHSHAMDLVDGDAVQLRERVLAAMTGLDNLFFVAGVSLRTDRGPIPNADARLLMNVNFVAGVSVVNAFLADLADNPNGNIVGMSSVAAARARRNNAVYGASKRGLEFYFDAVRHYLADRPCRVQYYRLGYLRTRMTQGQKLPFPAMDPSTAAKRICRNLGRNLSATYLPWWWFAIMSSIQLLPWPIYRRLNI
jgi:short-subunit dehydrogenase